MRRDECDLSGVGELQATLGDVLAQFASLDGGPEAVHATLGEFFHELRNRLNSLTLSIYLGERSFEGVASEQFSELNRITKDLIQFVESFQNICRPIRLKRVELPLCAFLSESASRWSSLWQERGGQLAVEEIRRPVMWEYDLTRWSQALDDFIVWRAQAVRGCHAKLSCRADGDRVTIHWREQGGERHEAPAAARPVSDHLELSLPYLLRVARAHGGNWVINKDQGFRLDFSFQHPPRMPSEIDP